jgi:hypothetical protein
MDWTEAIHGYRQIEHLKHLLESQAHLISHGRNWSVSRLDANADFLTVTFTATTPFPFMVDLWSAQIPLSYLANLNDSDTGMLVGTCLRSCWSQR